MKTTHRDIQVLVEKVNAERKQVEVHTVRCPKFKNYVITFFEKGKKGKSVAPMTIEMCALMLDAYLDMD